MSSPNSGSARGRLGSDSVPSASKREKNPRSASTPTTWRGLSGMIERSSAAMRGGMAVIAARSCWCMATATGSSLPCGWNTPFNTRDWLRTPSSASSALVRSASASAERSGRLTSVIVVTEGSERVATAAA